MGETMWNDFENRVGEGVAEVVDVDLKGDAIDTTDVLAIILMKGELDVGLAKLYLLPRVRSARMEKAGCGLFGKLSG